MRSLEEILTNINECIEELEDRDILILDSDDENWRLNNVYYDDKKDEVYFTTV